MGLRDVMDHFNPEKMHGDAVFYEVQSKTSR